MNLQLSDVSNTSHSIVICQLHFANFLDDAIAAVAYVRHSQGLKKIWRRKNCVGKDSGPFRFHSKTQNSLITFVLL
jgi:hypothetical protein